MLYGIFLTIFFDAIKICFVELMPKQRIQELNWPYNIIKGYKTIPSRHLFISMIVDPFIYITSMDRTIEPAGQQNYETSRGKFSREIMKN